MCYEAQKTCTVATVNTLTGLEAILYVLQPTTHQYAIADLWNIGVTKHSIKQNQQFTMLHSLLASATI